MGVLLTGQSFSKEKHRSTISIDPVIRSVQYNTVEGWVINLRASWYKRLDSTNPRHSFVVTPVIRYGFSNGHSNNHLTFVYNYGKKYPSSLTLSGGKRTFQMNNANPIKPFTNFRFYIILGKELCQDL